MVRKEYNRDTSALQDILNQFGVSSDGFIRLKKTLRHKGFPLEQRFLNNGSRERLLIVDRLNKKIGKVIGLPVLRQRD